MKSNQWLLSDLQVQSGTTDLESLAKSTSLSNQLLKARGSMSKPTVRTQPSLFPLHVVRTCPSGSQYQAYAMHSRDLTEVVQVLVDLLPRLLTSLELGSTGLGGEGALVPGGGGRAVGVHFIEHGLEFLSLLLSIKAKVSQ